MLLLLHMHTLVAVLICLEKKKKEKKNSNFNLFNWEQLPWKLLHDFFSPNIEMEKIKGPVFLVENQTCIIIDAS